MTRTAGLAVMICVAGTLAPRLANAQLFMLTKDREDKTILEHDLEGKGMFFGGNLRRPWTLRKKELSSRLTPLQ